MNHQRLNRGATVDKAFDNFAELSKAIGTNVQEKIDPFLAKMKERFLNDKNIINIGGKYFRINNNDIVCSYNQLTSLEGAPSEVGGIFNCSDNKLTSLNGAPSEVGGNFRCSDNQLTSLEHAPSEVGGDFYCYNNKLTSLEGSPAEVKGDFDCANNQLTSFEGAPAKVGGYFDCKDNQLTSLKGAPSKVGGYFYCSGNKLTKEQIAAYEAFLKMSSEQQKASGLLDDTGHYDPKE